MRPSFLDEMSWRMAEVYGAVTDRVMINLAKYFPFLKEGAELPGSFEYQARLLAQMGQVNRETAQIITQSLAGADEALQDALEAAILDALKNEEPKLRRAAEQGLMNGPGFLPPEVTPNQMQAFQTYYAQSADKLNLVNTVMLESTESAYRATVADVTARIQRTKGILNTATGEVVTGVSSWNQAMRDAVRRMVDNGLTGFIDHGGHRWSPEAYVAMDIRTTMFNTAREAINERAQEYGCDLYQVSSHNGARPLCYPWQGKVISRSDWTGEVEDLDGNKVRVYAQSETSYGQAAGLFGVNCKHYPMTFIPGFSTLKGQPQDPEENEKAYAESQEQRRLERKLREERRDLAVMKAQGADEDAIKAQKAKVRKASDDIEDFCDATGRARRRNREYTPVNASFEGAKTPPYGVPVTNVTNEYRARAKPGIGRISFEHEEQNTTDHEKTIAEKIHEQLGRDIIHIDNAGKKSKRDFFWNGAQWELKKVSSLTSADDQMREAIRQIKITGGNIILDIQYDDIEGVKRKILNRAKTSHSPKTEIMLLLNGKLWEVLRYNGK